MPPPLRSPRALGSPRTESRNARTAARGGAELQPRQHPTCQDTRLPLLLRPLLVRGTRLHAAGAQPCEGGHPVRATLTTWPRTTLATLAAVVAAPVGLSLAELPMPKPQHITRSSATAHRSPLTAHRSPSSRLACTGSSRGPGRPRACVRTASSRTPRPSAIAWYSSKRSTRRCRGWLRRPALALALALALTLALTLTLASPSPSPSPSPPL